MIKFAFESLRDKSLSIRKIAIQFLWNVIVKNAHQINDIISTRELVRLFNIQKHLIIRLSQPIIQFSKQD